MVLFYSLEEAAAILGVTTAELRKKTRSGEIRAFLRGGIWRLRISEIHEIARRQGYLTDQAVEAAATPNLVAADIPSVTISTPPANLPVRKPPLEIAVVLAPTEARPVVFPKIVVSQSSSPQVTTPSVESRSNTPPARVMQLKARTPSPQYKGVENANPLHALDQPIRAKESSNSATSEVADKRSASKPPLSSLDLEPPRSTAESVPAPKADPDESQAVEDILGQVEAFIGEIEESVPGNTGDSLSTPIDQPTLRTTPIRSSKNEAEPGWEQLLDTALAAKETSPPQTVSGGEVGQVAEAISTSPVPVEASNSESGDDDSATKGSGRPVVARGFFPIQCPNPECKVYGQVPISTLYNQLKCASCSTPFYVDRFSNSAVAGVRVVGKPSWMRASPASSKSRGPSRIERGFDRWVSLSPRAKVLSLTRFAGVLLACYVVYYFWPRVANTPDARTREVIAALDQNNPGRVRAIAVEDSAGAVDAWFKRIRSSSWPKNPSQSPPTVRILYSKKTKNKTVAGTLITFTDPNSLNNKPIASIPAGKTTPTPSKKAAPKKAEASRPIQIQLFWVKQSNEWLLDGKESLRLGEANSSN